MLTKNDLLNFLKKYKMESCNKKFSKSDVLKMSNFDLECWFALMTYQFTGNLKHSLENASLKMENKNESINNFFIKDPETY